MEKVIELLHKGRTLDQIAEELQTSAKGLKDALKDKYPLPPLAFSIGVEVEGFSTLGYLGVLNALRKEQVSIDFREWQENSLTGVSNWTLTTDGSVTGFKTQEDKGMELVSPIMYTMADLKVLKTILETVRNGRKMGGAHNMFKINQSCGIHVHFGVIGRPKEFLQRAYKLYRLLEPLLDSMLASSREFNTHHCKSVRDLPYKDAIKDSTSKYWSIRLKENRPTIEFRKHQGSTSYYKVYYWILILQQILNHALEIDSVSGLEKIATFDYLYKRVLKNPLLIAYFNLRKQKFDKTKQEKLGALHRHKAITKTVNKVLTEEELPY